jgi:hypothetical protein
LRLAAFKVSDISNISVSALDCRSLLYIATDLIYLISKEYLNPSSFLEDICIEAEKLNI